MNELIWVLTVVYSLRSEKVDMSENMVESDERLGR